MDYAQVIRDIKDCIDRHELVRTIPPALPRRTLNSLVTIIGEGAQLYVTSHSERYTATLTSSGEIIYKGRVFISPTAFCQFHSNRITIVHPRPTQPGNGWTHVRLVLNGKTIGEIHDAYYSRA